ncbi:uncharacterized protein [Dysidea avara]|uniref:uncharacterized protein isoform X1 n=1 Tax=Dysidea avara TaxID=196820 RepID=UPI0033182754
MALANEFRILAGVRPCGIIVLVSELFSCESISQVYAILHEYFRSNDSVAHSLEFICYDDGCHLRKYSCNPCRKDETPTAKLLAASEIVIDKMHFSGHTDKWCLATCNPNVFSGLNNVDTEICEQTFAWLSRYCHVTRHMTRNTFVFFLLYLCDLHNRREETKLRNSHYL